MSIARIIKRGARRTAVAKDPETTALYETIDAACTKNGLTNAVYLKALDALVERYVGKIHMKVEFQHCLAWLLDKGLRTLNT